MRTWAPGLTERKIQREFPCSCSSTDAKNMWGAGKLDQTGASLGLARLVGGGTPIVANGGLALQAEGAHRFSHVVLAL